MTTDLTKGKPFKLLLMFSLPIFIGNVFQQLYSMVDTIIVGQTISTNALAGVGATGAISFLVIGFVQGLTAGFSIKTAQYFGAKDYAGVRKSVATCYLLSIGITILVTILSVTTTMPLLRLMRTPEAIIQDAYNYIVVIYYGLAATVFYNMVSNILRAIGDSKTPLYFLILASLINIGLDFAFIVGLKSGVAGAGWATVLSQLISGFACLIYMLKKFPMLRLKKEDWKVNSRMCLQHLYIGLPMALQFSITAVGVMVQQAALNTLGEVAVAAYTAASKIDNLAVQSLVALGSGIATYAGQNYGANEFGRIKKGVNICLIMTVVLSCLGTALVIFLGRLSTKLFIPNASEEILAMSEQFLFYQGVFYIPLGLIFVYRNALQGIGRSTLTMLAGVTELVMRIVAAFVLVKYYGFLGICLSNPAAWLGADVFLLIAYYLIMRKYRNRDNQKLNELKLNENRT